MINNATSLLADAASAFAFTYVTMAVLLRLGLAARLAIDLPNHRSLHESPIPRVGGIAAIAGILIPLLFRGGGQHVVLAAAVVGLAVVSFADDRAGLPIGLRLVSHLTLGALWLIIGVKYPVGWTAIPLLFGVVWSVNLYNFMDGADGLAGGMAVCGFAICAAAAWLGGELPLAQISVAASMAAAAFLFFNFPPARSFLGDVGSVPLGFLAAAVGIEGWIRGAWPLWFPLIVFSPFAVDATATLLKRIFRGAQVWKAHRDHYYQRLVRMGWSHRRLALAEYALMVVAGLSALLMLNLAPAMQFAGIGFWAIVYVVLMTQVDRHWKRFVATGGSA